MANEKSNTLKVHRDAQKGEFITTISPRKPYAEKLAVTLKSFRRSPQIRSISPIRDTKTDLGNAISEAARDDAQKSKSMTIKDAKRARRDVVVKTIMRHNRQAH